MNRSTDERSTFLIWDVTGTPPKGKWIPVLWRSFSEGNDLLHSIPKLVEEQAAAVRGRYLDWIYSLGEAQIKGKRLVDHLELRPGFSYWWMTLIAEKSNAYKSFQITDAVKLLVLEELVIANSVSAIILVSGDKTLAQVFRLWTKNAGMAYEWRPVRGGVEPASLIIRLYRSLPKPVQAAFSMARSIWQSWPLKQRDENPKAAGSDAMTFADYLIHLDNSALTTGRFASNFWTDLIDALDRSGSRVNWLHRYIPHEAIKSPKQARDLILRFNQGGTERQFHICLDGEISISVVLAALIDYGRIVRMWLRLSRIKRQFRPNKSKLDFWPLFRQDWLNSMLGPDAISNCLVVNLLERTLRRLPRQNLGIYLQENQGWEMALIYSWRAAGNGRLIGVPHSTVRFWDLRYYYDPRNYQRTGKNDVPMPDKVALNGPAAVAAYRKGGCPAAQIEEVEALRFMYLADLPPMLNVANMPSFSTLSVLVLGDYRPAITYQQMQWLIDAAPHLPPDTRYIVKAHPSCPVEASDYPSLHLQISSLPLAKLLRECDLAYTSNITSAAVDAYCAGLPVVSVLDSDSFNMSPLLGLEGVLFVTNPTELAVALQTARDCARESTEPYFFLDKGLPCWRKLLGISSPHNGGPIDS